MRTAVTSYFETLATSNLRRKKAPSLGPVALHIIRYARLRLIPAKPSNAEPNSQAAAGMGTSDAEKYKLPSSGKRSGWCEWIS